MHAVFFGLKRAWQSSLRVTRHALATTGLTAARFDMLYAIHHDAAGSCLQSELRRILGVSRSTVSVMLGSLEALGLVRRHRLGHRDRRQRTVLLTDRGRTWIRRAMMRLMWSGAAQLAVDVGAAGESWHSPRWSFWWVNCLDDLLRAVRRNFGDHGNLRYPWHPED